MVIATNSDISTEYFYILTKGDTFLQLLACLYRYMYVYVGLNE